jgi:hypothetical protein
MSATSTPQEVASPAPLPVASAVPVSSLLSNSSPAVVDADADADVDTEVKSKSDGHHRINALQKYFQGLGDGGGGGERESGDGTRTRAHAADAFKGGALRFVPEHAFLSAHNSSSYAAERQSTDVVWSGKGIGDLFPARVFPYIMQQRWPMLLAFISLFYALFTLVFALFFFFDSSSGCCGTDYDTGDSSAAADRFVEATWFSFQTFSTVCNATVLTRALLCCAAF